MLDNTKETTLRDEFQRYIRDELIGRDVDPISWRDAEDYQLFPLLSSLGLDKTKEEITLRDEFQKYIKDEPIGMDFDPISWWDGKGCQLFPLLSTFAYEYLSIPVILTPISKHVPEQIWKIVQ
ncbi:uncharacterized protein LOC122529575 [Frieseomelitta varia]|uniref:uncharacterized protein LOC122529575 n=1 Tax=Frieseomelitta varia TaxID=561572 RepID=UPI001CB67926|nr:uncharacterized protein LOC122529575 [Frieseomelitta varia]